MKTKQVFLVLILILSAYLAKAQENDKAKMSFGIIGGINFQNLNGKNMLGDKLENDMIIGFHAGANIQIPIAPEFYFEPGLLLSTKGAKSSFGLITSTQHLSYVEMPLNLLYKAALGKGSFMLGFGPYVAYAIGGKVITEGGAVTITSKVAFKNTVELNDPMLVTYYRPFDAGGNIFFGYELSNGIYAQFNTQLGMLKINPKDNRFANDKTIIKNTGFGLSLGFRF